MPIEIKTAREIVRLHEARHALRSRLRRLDNRRKEEREQGDMSFSFVAQDGSWQSEKISLTPVVLGYVRKSIESQIADVERKLRGLGAELTD